MTRAAVKEFSMDAEAAALQLLLCVKVLEAFLCPKKTFSLYKNIFFISNFLSAISKGDV